MIQGHRAIVRRNPSFSSSGHTSASSSSLKKRSRPLVLLRLLLRATFVSTISCSTAEDRTLDTAAKTWLASIGLFCSTVRWSKICRISRRAISRTFRLPSEGSVGLPRSPVARRNVLRERGLEGGHEKHQPPFRYSRASKRHSQGVFGYTPPSGSLRADLTAGQMS